MYAMILVTTGAITYATVNADKLPSMGSPANAPGAVPNTAPPVANANPLAPGAATTADSTQPSAVGGRGKKHGKTPKRNSLKKHHSAKTKKHKAK